MKLPICPALLLSAAAFWGSSSLQAQFNIFEVDGHTVQVHAFASQGYALSNDNNYLTMQTSKGSFDFTDGGLNVSTNLTDKFRVGAQLYDRSIGQLGGGRISLDWAFGDYKFKDWFGVRAGKVKTVLGLWNDTQDAESVHTWAILPQAMYPTDLRPSRIAHVGADVYGNVGLKKFGSLRYTGYVGKRSDDRRSGYYFNTQDSGVPIQSFEGVLIGMDTRWMSPVPGLTVGASFLDESYTIKGIGQIYRGAPYTLTDDPLHDRSFYADFTRGRLHMDTELRLNTEIDKILLLGQYQYLNRGDRGFFASAAWRFTSWLEAGAYNSRYYVTAPSTPEAAANHIFDQTATLRFDVRKWWDVKLEGHFIDGYGDIYSAHGFYIRSNPTGLKPKTDLFVVRTGFYF